MSERSVLVVGAGVIGAACAHFLVQDGWKVTILDAGGFGRGCSHGNCGYVCPSHVLPLAVPGAAWNGFKALFQTNGPLKIKPRLDPALWSWLIRFARRCNRRHMLEAGRGIQALLNSSRALYPELIQEQQLDCEWETRGLLFTFLTSTGMEHAAATNGLLNDSFGLAAQRLDRDALLALEPALKPSVAGGWLFDTDAHLRPDKLMAAWRCSLQDRGVTFHENCPVQGITRGPGRARAVVTPLGELTADFFVFATGALTPFFGRDLGCKIPIQPGKGYSITMPRPARCPSIPLIFEEHRVAITPMRSGYRIGSTMEFAGYDTTIDPQRLQLLRDGASHYLQEPVCEPVIEEWYGWRPMTYDGLPIIDHAPELRNVLIAAGHSMLGLSMAPATGKLIAEMLDERTPHVDPTPYRVTRFQG